MSSALRIIRDHHDDQPSSMECTLVRSKRIHLCSMVRRRLFHITELSHDLIICLCDLFECSQHMLENPHCLNCRHNFCLYVSHESLSSSIARGLNYCSYPVVNVSLQYLAKPSPLVQNVLPPHDRMKPNGINISTASCQDGKPSTINYLQQLYHHLLPLLFQK